MRETRSVSVWSVLHLQRELNLQPSSVCVCVCWFSRPLFTDQFEGPDLVLEFSLESGLVFTLTH